MKTNITELKFAPPLSKITPPQIKKFWLNTDRRSDSECWNWKSTKDNWGYGRISMFDTEAKSHRFSWVIHFGGIPEGLCVLHRCDNPACVNPKHLFLGTNLENIQDRHIKMRDAFGEKNSHAKLTRDCVSAIRKRAMNGERQRDLCKEYKISTSQICSIVNKKSWRHTL